MSGTGPGEDSRRELVALGAVLAVAAVYLAVRFEPFLIPNNDFHSFADTAARLADGALPFESKRLPLLPALMALVGAWLPGPHAYLDAALLWNAAFSLGSIACVFVLARRFVDRGAILAPILYVATMQLFGSGLQPLVDASLGFFVVAAFVAFAARSPWQWVAAAAVSLSRYEAAVLIPVLVLGNALFDGRAFRQVVLGGLSLLPLLAWRVGAALHGGSGSTYLDLMEGMGFAPAPAYLGRVLGEAFPILYAPTPLLPVAGVLVGVPLVLGVAEALRRDRRLAATALGFFVAEVGAVVVFGIPKARYAQAVTWLPVVFWTLGGLRAARMLETRLPEPAPDWHRRLGWAALFGAALVGFAFMGTRPALEPESLEPVAAVLWAGAAGFALGGLRERAPFLLLLAGLALLLLTGLTRQRTALFDVHYANHGSYRVGGWFRDSLPEGEAVVVLNPGAVGHASGFPIERLLTFGASRSGTPEELAAFMRERGATHVAWTWRPPVRSRSASYYHERMNVELADVFRSGDAVPGYEHVVELSMPDGVDEAPAQIYRLVSSSP
ncbi:MAG: hypothetical protein QNK05_17485 [Myxococcota bacterium]|nr:hypothetical protein [Myxococcota bacterium]